MKNQFEEFINGRLKNPKIHEVQEILSIFNECEFEKGALFKERDTAIDHLGFLVDGSSRTYFVNGKGDEITDEILPKNNFLSDIISVRTGKQSTIVIELLEKSKVLVAPMEMVWELLESNIAFNILIREYIGDRAMELVKRQQLFLNGTAKQRYQYMITTNPSLIEKFPLRYIASMIGVTQTQLSRIRKEKM